MCNSIVAPMIPMRNPWVAVRSVGGDDLGESSDGELVAADAVADDDPGRERRDVGVMAEGSRLCTLLMCTSMIGTSGITSASASATDVWVQPAGLITMPDTWPRDS